jgi:kinetochore protein Spc7/SPC105
MNFNNPEDFSSSPYSGASDDTNQTFVTADEVDKDSDSSSNVDDLVEDETVTGIDGDDNTVHSAGNSTGSSGRLEAALQQAAKQAGTQGIDYDEHGDITMEMADEEVTDAFKPWIKKGTYVPQVVGDPSALQDQENLNPFSPAFKANVAKRMDEAEDGTMDITQAVGGILPSADASQSSPRRRRRKSIIGNRRRSSVARRRSSGDGSALGDETMDLTMAIGGIQQNQEVPISEGQDGQSADEDEELTMEFTSVVGGVVQQNSREASSADDQLANNHLLQDASCRESAGSYNNDETMDITFAAGGILPSITERTEPPEDRTQDMDITAAVGAILPVQLSTGNKAEAKLLMEQETDIGQLSGSPFFGTPRQKPLGVGLSDERALPAHVKAMASETGSPSFTTSQTRGNARRSLGRPSAISKSPQPTPVKKPNTPSKQLTPQMMRPTTPGKTPPSKNVTMRTASPKKLFKAEIRAEAKKTSDSTPRPSNSNPLFRQDMETGAITPSIVLKPHKRRSSGLGIDREGLGSPRVTALLDRRGSIGENAKAFVAQGPAPSGVRFANPQAMEQELDQERAEDQRRESGRGILEDEADYQDLEEDATANLKNMIESLTPQKKKLKGRKSLHVGAAKGLLGKRPAELDDDEGEEDSPKRLKGREGSPVKKVKLPAPPPKTATTGRTTRSTRRSLAETASNFGTPSGIGSPLKTGTSPKDQSRFKDAEARSPAKVQPFEQKLDASAIGGVDVAQEEDRIHLQDFLNMTSIRFMELTTTKRRHTVAPNAMLEQSAKKASLGPQDEEQADAPNELENCVVTGACTVPMLELYQHVSHCQSQPLLECNANEGLVMPRIEELHLGRP